MLNEAMVYATIAVKNIEAGKQFYGSTLGLTQLDESPAGVMYKSGDGQIFVYQSTTGGTNRATCAAWRVENLESIIEQLRSNGVSFEHYDMPQVTWEGDIAVGGGMKVAWFKDPDGNILALGANA